MLTTKRKISVRNKEYTINKFKYQRKEIIRIMSAKEMGHRVVGGVAPGSLAQPTEWALGLEPRAIAGSSWERALR